MTGFSDNNSGYEYRDSNVRPGEGLGRDNLFSSSFMENLSQNALFPPNLPVTHSYQGGSLKTVGGNEFQEIAGVSNPGRIYGPVRNIFGQWKVHADVAAEPYRITTGDTQHMYVVFDFGYGHVDLDKLSIGTALMKWWYEIDYKVWKNYTNEPLQWYKNDRATVTTRAELHSVTWGQRPTPSTVSDEITLEWSFPHGLYAKNADNSTRAETVVLQIRYELAGSGVQRNLDTASPHASRAVSISGDRLTITEHRTAPFILTTTLKLPQQGNYIIRYKRGNADRWRNDPNIKDQCELVTLSSATYRPPLDFKTPHTVVEMRIMASNNIHGNLDTCNAIAKRHVPVWDGTNWTTQFSRNPAWVALEILRGPSNPYPITDDKIDLPAFKRWADWCDAKAAQGDTRFTCDANIEDESTVYDKLLEVMQSARASFALHNGKYSVIYEHWPTTPAQVFTPVNSWGFTSHRVFPRQVDGLKVLWNDPTREYEPIETIVYDDGKDETNSQYFESVSAGYCTRWAQAFRTGRYYLAVGKLRQEMVTIITDIESLICERGDLVEIQHDAALVGGTPSTIRSINGANVTLRAPVFWDTADQYRMRIRYDDATSEEFPVTAQVDPYTITLDHAPTKAHADDLVVYGKANFVTDQFLVKSVTPGDELTATLTLVPIARAIATADTTTIPPYNRPVTDESVNPTCITDLTISPTIGYENRIPVTTVALQWGSRPYANHYEVWVSDNDKDWTLDRRVDTNFCLLWDSRSTVSSSYPTGPVYVKVIPVAEVGARPILATCASSNFTPLVDVTPPDKPLFFSGNVSGTTIHLSWLPPDDPDIAGYVLRFTPQLTATKWEEAITERELIPYDSFATDVNVRIGTYLIKTIDTSGNYSKDFAAVRTTIPKIDGVRVFKKEEESPGFTGKMSDVEKDGNAIKLSQKYPGGACEAFEFGTYEWANTIDLNQIYEVYLSALVEAHGGFCVSPTISEGDEWDVVIQIRVSSAHPIVMADWLPNIAAINPIAQSGTGGWSGWQRLTAGNYTGRQFQFRAVLTSKDGSAWPIVTKLAVEIDLPERIVAEHDKAVAVGGTRILFPDGPFHDVPAVACTEDDADVEDTLKITGVAEDGFTAEIFDKAGRSKVGQVDYVAKGFGRKMTAAYSAIDAHKDDDLKKLPGALARPVSINMLS